MQLLLRNDTCTTNYILYNQMKNQDRENEKKLENFKFKIK